MSCDFNHLTHRQIQKLAPYVPGKSSQEILPYSSTQSILKLASNENPLGCSHAVIAALKSLSLTSLSQYPVYAHHAFLPELARHLGVDTAMVALGNGSDALFGLLLICFALGQDKHILTHQYAFSSYTIQAQTYAIPVVTTELRDWQVNIDAMIARCNDKTALIFIANPNNPTGGYCTEIPRLLANIPSTTILVLDEAYYEYVTPSRDSIALLKKYRNLVITRTFSKAYGLAGLRLGYAIADPQIVTLLRKIHLPFAINSAVLTAASVALRDQEFVRMSRETNVQNRQKLAAQLDQHQIAYLPSTANFLTINCQEDSLSIVRHLEKNGIIVRPLHPYGLTHYLRVTIGTAEENERFQAAFITIVDQQGTRYE